MEISVQVDKITKFTRIFFLIYGEGADDNLYNRTNYQGCQYDVHFIHCQEYIGLHFESRKGV